MKYFKLTIYSLTALISLTFFAHSAHASVEYISAANKVNVASGNDSFTSFAVSGTNPAIFIVAGVYNGSVASVAVSDGLTTGTPYLVKAQVNGTTDLEIWAIPAPSGTGTITVTYSTSTSHQCSAILVQGADQTTPAVIADADSTTGSTSPLSVTPSNLTASDLVVYGGAQSASGDAPHVQTGTEVFYGNSTPVNMSAGYHNGTGTASVTWGATATTEAVVGVRAQTPTGGASAALTGTITSSATQSDIVAGGKTIILTLTGDTWVASGTTFNNQRQNIINGLDSAQSETHGWDAEVKAKIAVTDVVRTSDTVVTITLDAEAGYAITSNETITATIPATALSGNAQIIASPTFTVSAPVINATEFVSVVDTGGTGDYSSLSAWQTGVVTDLTAATTQVFAGTRDDAPSDNATVYLCTSGNSYRGESATVVHATDTQILVDVITNAVTEASTDYWYSTNTCSGGTKYFTLSNGGDSAIAVADCQDTTGAADTATVTITGWTTSATNYVKIWTNPSEGYRHAGKWDDGKYRLEITRDNGDALLIDQTGYVKIDGLQVSLSAAANSYNGIHTLNPNGVNTLYEISNNIVRGVLSGTASSKGIYADFYSTHNTKIWNNIVYDFINGSNGIGARIEVSGSGNGYVYNNTVYNCGVGIRAESGNIYAKNDIAYNNGTDYSGSFDSSSTNNLSKDGTAPAYNAYFRNATVTFVSTASGSQDFHLASTDTGAFGEGADLTSDSNLPITTDIDGQNRPNLGNYSWDIGADQAIHNRYSSVGQNNSTDYSSGGTVSISGIVANFDTPQTSTHIGVGDVVTYGGGSKCRLTRKITTSSWICLELTTAGAPPAVSGASFSISHRFASLNDAVANMSGDDYVATNSTINIPCYYDSGPDTTSVTVSSITTDATHYVRIYTPYDTTNEVNQSQRASGKWDTGKYSLSNPSPITIETNYTRIDGLQIETTGSGSSWPISITIGIGDINSDLQISNNIIKGNYTTTNDGYGIAAYAANSSTVKIWNNIIYNFTGSSGGNSYALFCEGDTGVVKHWYVYNNTIYGSDVGFYASGDSITIVAKNNISYNNSVSNYGSGPYDSSSTNNLSSSSDAPGSNPQNNATVAFMGAAQSDFRLSLTDTAAKGAGANLSADPNLAFQDDIEGHPRPGSGIAWDIGADQAGNVEVQSSNLKSQSLTNGLVGYWSMDGNDISGNTVKDLSNNGNDGTNNGATSAIGKRGQALRFNGTSDYVKNNVQSTPPSQLTISFWMKTSDSSLNVFQWGNIFLDVYNGCGGCNHKMILTDNGDFWSGLQGNTTVDDSAWHHIVGVIDGTSETLYVDGTQDATRNHTPVLTSDYIYIGNNTLGAPTSIDEVRIYNRALSAQEVGDLYRLGQDTINTSQVGNATNGLVGYWSFDGPDISGTTAYDRSGNNNNGTISGATPTIGHNGQALSFDGTSDLVSVSDNSSILPANNITVEAWFKLNKPLSQGSVDYPVIMFKQASQDPWNSYSIQLNKSSNVVGFGWRNSGGTLFQVTTSTTLNANQWYHVVGIRNGTSIKIYLNGNEDMGWSSGSPGSSDTIYTTNSSALTIGAVAAGNSNFDGSIDEPRVYNRALSAQEVKDLYNMGSVKITN